MTQHNTTPEDFKDDMARECAIEQGYITQTPEDVEKMIYDHADDEYRAAVDRMADTDTINTGVCNSNAPMWLYEDIGNAIDINYEEYLAENPEDEYGDDYYNDSPTYLIGFIKIGEFYEPDKSAGYSAIVSEVYTQIVKSKYISLCEYCSPCFPDRGDLGTAGYVRAYTLPPDVWGESEHLDIEEI